VFQKLNQFVVSRTYTEYSDMPLTNHMYSYFMELYRKLNIKNTMSGTYMRIKEIKTQIDANEFSINYSKQSIEVKSEELAM